MPQACKPSSEPHSRGTSHPSHGRIWQKTAQTRQEPPRETLGKRERFSEPGSLGSENSAVLVTLQELLTWHFIVSYFIILNKAKQPRHTHTVFGGSQMKWWLHRIFHRSFLLRAGKSSCQQWVGCALPPQKPEAKPPPESVILLLRNAVRV